MQKYLYLSALMGSLLIAEEPEDMIIDLDTISETTEKPKTEKPKNKIKKTLPNDDVNSEITIEPEIKKSSKKKATEIANSKTETAEISNTKDNKNKAKKADVATSHEPTHKEKEILSVIAKYPDIVAGLIQQGVQAKQAQERVLWAQKVRENLPEITEKSIKFISDESGPTVLMFVDFLCPHCRDHLKSISEVRKKQPKLNFMIYSIPLFEGDLSREYGLIMNAAFRKDPEKFKSLLEKYGECENSKEKLLEKVKEFKIKIDTDSIKDLSTYEDRKTLMEKIGFTQVPVNFILLSDKLGDKEGRMIVIPIPNMGADQLIKTVDDLNKTTSEQRKKLKEEELGQN